MAIILPLQRMVTPSHPQGRTGERAVGMRFHVAVSLLIVDFVDKSKLISTW